MKKKAYVLLEGINSDEEIDRLTVFLEDTLGHSSVKVQKYDTQLAVELDAAAFFDTSGIGGGKDAEKDGWHIVKEDQIHLFFVFYIEVGFEGEELRLEEIWLDRAERYLMDPALGQKSAWRCFCGNDLSNKRIYISPVRQDNVETIKSIFRIFLNKQLDDMRLQSDGEVKLRCYFTALELPYSTMDSSERLIPACSNIYKLAESLDQDKLYLSEGILEHLPGNIRKNMREVEGQGNLYSYAFNILT